jgi:dienelactone hydrolase
MSPEQAKQTQRILADKSSKGKDDGIQHEFVLYRGANYGFAQGSNMKKVAEAEAGERAEKQAVDWFARCFASLRP